jgi:hypothetical protein
MIEKNLFLLLFVFPDKKTIQKDYPLFVKDWILEENSLSGVKNNIQ